MRYLTAPWRAEYVRKVLSLRRCIFCDALKAGNDRTAAVLFRGRRTFVMLNRYPYTPGHLMIAPFRHLADFTRARADEGAELFELLQVALRVLGRAYKPQGFNTGMNLGRSAGAGVTGHVHLHVIPRWTGDSNFMPLAGGTRVFIEDLEATYERLRPLFDRERPRVKRAER
jgi:ATP adenylyltransferase